MGLMRSGQARARARHVSVLYPSLTPPRSGGHCFKGWRRLMRSGQARARHVSVLYPSASFRVRVLRPPCSCGHCFKGWRMGVFGTHALGPATSPSCTRQQEACDPATRQASPSRPSRQRAELLHNARADTSPRIRHQTRPSPSPSVRGSNQDLSCMDRMGTPMGTQTP